MRLLIVVLLFLSQTTAIQAVTYAIADTSGTRGAKNVDVKVWLRNGDGYSGGQFDVQYDSNIMTATGVVAGNLSLESSFLVQGNTNEAGTARIIIAGASRAKQTQGVLAVIRFDIKDNATFGASSLNIAGELKAFHEDLRTLDVQTTSGTFTVVEVQADPTFGVILTVEPPRIRAGDSIKVAVNGIKLQGAVGVTVRLSYDPTKLEFMNFIANENFITPGEKLNDDPPYVEIGVAILGETIQTNSSLIGHVTFLSTPAFSTTNIRSSFAELRRKGAEGFETIDPKSTVEIIEGCAEDFDGNGEIDFRDFFLFAENFGSNIPLFDLDKDGNVGLGDFLTFIESFVTGCE